MKKSSFALLRTFLLLLSLSFCATSCDELDIDNPFGDFNKQENDTTSFALYQFAENSLSGWDEGYFYSNEDGSICPYYIVSSTDSINGDIIVCLNETVNTDINKSLLFHFSKEGDVLEILLPGYRLDAQSYEEKVDFVAYDVQGEAQGFFSVPYIKADSLIKPMTRSPFFNSKGEFSVSKTMNFVEFGEKVTNVLGNVYNLSEGNYGEVVADFLLGNMTGAVKSFFGRIFVPLTVKGIFEWAYEEAKKCWIGDATIQITSVKRTSETTVTVEGVLSETYTIPLIYMTVVDGVADYKENVVRYGVAVGKNSYPGLYLNENCSDLEVVVEDGIFSFTFYMDETPGEVFYFRPFLVPESKLKGEDALFPTPVTCIRYGKAKEFMDFSVEMSNFEQVKCLKNGKKYNVQFTIDASIPGLFDDLASWGFDVKTKSGNYEKRYYANDKGEYIPPTEKSFTCDVDIVEADIENLNNERLAEITITPFIVCRNSLPSMRFFDEEKYNLTITDNLCPNHNHPHMIDLGLPSGTKWACCNVGATSPEDYGGYYAWGETEEKGYDEWSTYKWCNGSYDTMTKYCTKSYYGTVDNKTVLDPEDDVAHVKWGGSWRMPTFDEQAELRNNCTRTWTTQNGVNGYKVTGPNGNSIFLPAAGYRGGTEVYDRGSRGDSWSSSLGSDGSYGACVLSFLSGGRGWSYGSRCYGRSVRPVSE